MLINRWFVAAAIGFGAFQTQSTFAAGSGHSHGHSGNHSQSNNHNHNQSQSGLPAFANSWPYLRAENGIFGPLWAAPGPGSLTGFGNGGGFGDGGGGWGGGGWGWGSGGGTADYEYYIGRRPYFSVYSPVYYDYVDGAIVPKTPIQFPMANAAYQPAGSQPSANQQAPGGPQAANSASETSPAPLMIANPYYKAEK